MYKWVALRPPGETTEQWICWMSRNTAAAGDGGEKHGTSQPGVGEEGSEGRSVGNARESTLPTPLLSMNVEPDGGEAISLPLAADQHRPQE